ncbi:hypothetical protein Aperf_G00000032063 [Anoplocephala perfoliata]
MDIPVSSYVTTDVLKTHKSSKSAKNASKKVSVKDVYPIKKVLRKGRSRSKIVYLTYIPGNGIIKSGEKSGHQHTSRFRGDSPSSASSSSSDSSTSSSTSGAFERYEIHRSVSSVSSNRAPVRRSRSSSRSSSSSSSAAEDRQGVKINTWGNQESRSSSSSSESRRNKPVRPRSHQRNSSSRKRNRK